MSRSVQSLKLQLTQRDIDIVLMAYRYEGLASSLIKRRFFGQNGASRLYPRPFHRRVKQLVSHGYLKVVDRLPSENGLGSGQYWLTVGPAAYPLLREYLGLSTSDLRRIPQLVPYHWRHEVQLRRVRLCFEMACEESSGLVQLAEWVNENALRRSQAKVSIPDQQNAGSQLTVEFVPDGILVLQLQGRTKRYFLEVDRGSMVSPTRFKQRLAAYLLQASEPTPVLLVVPDDKRRIQLAGWAIEEAGRLGLGAGIFAFALSPTLTQQSILGDPVWLAVDGTKFSLVPQHLSSQDAPSRANTAFDLRSFLQNMYGEGGGSS